MEFGSVIKAAIGRQVKAMGGVEAAAALVGMGKTQLANYQHPDRDERVPLVVALRLDEAGGDPLVLRTAAADHTFTTAERRQIAKRAMDLQSEISALLAAIGTEGE